MGNLEELTRIAREVDVILQRELEKANISYDLAEVRIYNVKTVGVQGDERTYTYPAEINLRQRKGIFWDPEFLANLSTKITNEVKDVNRVVYVLAAQKE